MNALHGGIVAWSQSLFRACWQGGVLIVTIAILCRLLTRLPANARCTLWWFACLKLLIGLVWATPVSVALLPAPQQHAAAQGNARTDGTGMNQGGHGSTPASSGNTPVTAAAPTLSGPVVPLAHTTVRAATSAVAAQAAAQSSASAARFSLTAILLALWLVGALFRLIISLMPLRRVQRLLAAATVVNDPEIQQMMQSIAHELGLRQAPCLLLTEAATEPLAVSHWQNVVLLSQSDYECLSREELRAVLAHEFAHIRRADLLLGLIPFATQIVFWFHPFAWLACHEFAISREAACDAAALQAAHTPTRTYSELLLKLGTRHVPLGPAVALGATSQFRILQRRIIMMHQTPRCSQRLLFAGLTALFVPVIGLGLVPWQLVTAQAALPAATTRLKDQGQTVQTPTTETKISKPKEAGTPKLRTAPINMDFATGLEGWHFSSHNGEDNFFDHGLDTAMLYDGTPSPFLYATANLPKIYGVMTQWISAEPYHGKRVRFSAYIKTQGVKVYAGPMLGLVGGANDRTYVMEHQPI